MLLTLTPKEDTPLKEILFCDSIRIDKLENPRIVPLFGPNGIGKSSVIEGIMQAGNSHKRFSKYTTRAREFEVTRTPANMTLLTYRDRKDNASIREANSINESFDPNFIHARWQARSISEGQSIIYSIMDLLTIIGTTKDALHPENGSEYLVLIDELDSGLSIDNLDFVMRKLKRTSMFRNDVQVIFSFNNPYVVNYFPQVISLYTGEPCKLFTPKDMLDEMKIHEKEFRKKRYYANGRPRIFE